MPRGDRTGPVGQGPRTGRAAGYCAGYAVPGYVNPMPGRGFGMGGWGRGRRWRHWFYATGLPGQLRVEPVPEQETEALKAQADWLQGQLDAVQQRLSELEKHE